MFVVTQTFLTVYGTKLLQSEFENNFSLVRQDLINT